MSCNQEQTVDSFLSVDLKADVYVDVCNLCFRFLLVIVNENLKLDFSYILQRRETKYPKLGLRCLSDSKYVLFYLLYFNAVHYKFYYVCDYDLWMASFRVYMIHCASK